MSAEKCGEPSTVEQVRLARKQAEEPVENQLIVSHRANVLLQKIRGKYPDFQPTAEADILRKAYSMGLTDEE